MYDLHRAMKLVEDESPKSSTDTKILFGESRRHDVGAEGVLIDSLHDNMLTSLNDRINALGNDVDLYHEGVINDSCDILDCELTRFEKSCEALTTCSENGAVRLYAEAKRNFSVKAILAKIMSFFKGIPAMIARIFGRVTAAYRKLRVRSRYLVNRAEFFESFSDTNLKNIRANVKFDLAEVKHKHSAWIEQNKAKLDKLKLTGDDEKDYKAVLNYIVGWMPLKSYGMTNGGLGKVDENVMTDIFGKSMVSAVFSLASHAATMEDNSVYDDVGTLSTSEALNDMLGSYPFLDISSQTTQSAFDGTPLAGIHTLLSKHHIYVTKLNESLNLALTDALYSRRHGSDKAEHSIERLTKATKKAANAAESLKACLTKPTTKRTRANLSLILLYTVMIQQSLTAMLLGNAENLDNVLHANMYRNTPGKATGAMPSWGDIQKAIDDTKGSTVGYAKIIAEYKLSEILSLMDVFDHYEASYDSSMRENIDKLANTTTITGNVKDAKLRYDQMVKLEEWVTDFIAGYDGNDERIHSAINEYVRRANRLHVSTVDMTKVTTTLIDLIGMANNYRMAVIMDLAYRMQTVTDMFGMAKLILEEKKANAVSSKETGGNKAINGHLAFNS